jgi:hypothetical protein
MRVARPVRRAGRGNGPAERPALRFGPTPTPTSGRSGASATPPSWTDARCCPAQICQVSSWWFELERHSVAGSSRPPVGTFTWPLTPDPDHLTVLTRSGVVGAACHPHPRPRDRAAPSFTNPLRRAGGGVLSSRTVESASWRRTLRRTTSASQSSRYAPSRIDGAGSAGCGPRTSIAIGVRAGLARRAVNGAGRIIVASAMSTERARLPSECGMATFITRGRSEGKVGKGTGWPRLGREVQDCSVQASDADYS